MIGTGKTLDDYIKDLENLRNLVGGQTQCWTDGGSDYPEGAIGPCLEVRGNAYTPQGVVLLK